LLSDTKYAILVIGNESYNRGIAMSEELLKQIEELKAEVEKLSRRNKLLQRKLSRIRKKGESLDDETQDLKEYTKLNRIIEVEEVERCEKCGAPTETITFENGALTLCTVCEHREFIK